VSIFCITYNHEKFIRDAIEGFLMQETTFPVEIFVHDDASTDDTPRILEQYALKYPNHFKIVIQKQNQWSKQGNQLFFELLSNLKGKYIAICEGDDYWIKPEKLETQFKVLKTNPASSGCYHRVYVEKRGERKELYPAKDDFQKVDLKTALKKHSIPTCSLFIRKKTYLNMRWAKKLLMADWPLITECAKEGMILPLEGIYAVYRNHDEGLWNRQSQYQRAEALQQFYDTAHRHYKKEITDELKGFRKTNIAYMASAAYAEGKVLQVLKSYCYYFFCGPKKFLLPKKQKRIWLYLLTFGLLKYQRIKKK